MTPAEAYDFEALWVSNWASREPPGEKHTSRYESFMEGCEAAHLAANKQANARVAAAYEACAAGLDQLARRYLGEGDLARGEVAAMMHQLAANFRIRQAKPKGDG